MTLALLRQLLEDDVKNLARMQTASGANSGGSDERERGVSMDIHDSELQLIMNRNLLFPKDASSTTGYGQCQCEREGVMYDIVEVTASSALQGVKYA